MIVGVVASTQCCGGARVGPRRASQAQVDAAGGKCFEHSELLGDDERGVVGQHDAAGAEADRRGLGYQPRQHQLRRRGRRSWHGVVLGHPEAAVAASFRSPGEVDDSLEGFSDVLPDSGMGVVEDREGEWGDAGSGCG